jgi:hypothetical protein
MEVVCGSCGGGFTLSKRNVRAARQRGEAPICSFCRRTRKPPDPATMERMKRWWLEKSGLSLDELLEIGREIGWS